MCYNSFLYTTNMRIHRTKAFICISIVKFLAEIFIFEKNSLLESSECNIVLKAFR